MASRPTHSSIPTRWLPGALPVPNAEAVRLGTRRALALGCTVHPVSIFARKHYFYPDLPKGYQISQFEEPLATKGAVNIESPERGRISIGVTRLHLEEDAGKSLHDRLPGRTAVDLNRAGVPLAEIVSEPDMRSAAEARAYLTLLRQLLVYAGVSECSMEKGTLRVDANVSVRRAGDATFGAKAR
jgi:aspartyl-tRNA(Asn)/glutamyl-tRNA(Gln) amidotransferase subunit B